MARTVTDNRATNGTPVNNTVDEICRGQYVLVLGSDIMLDKNYNKEANGNSTKFFLNKVIEQKNSEGVSFPTKAETFPDLILDNVLRKPL